MSSKKELLDYINLKYIFSADTYQEIKNEDLKFISKINNAWKYICNNFSSPNSPFFKITKQGNLYKLFDFNQNQGYSHLILEVELEGLRLMPFKVLQNGFLSNEPVYAIRLIKEKNKKRDSYFLSYRMDPGKMKDNPCIRDTNDTNIVNKSLIVSSNESVFNRLEEDLVNFKNAII